MSENEQTTEQTTEPSDKEINFQKLREQKEALEAELAELRPLRVKETLREAGFDPSTPEGKALALAVEAGKVEADSSLIAEYAGSEFGWQPKTALTPTEASQVEGSQRLAAARAASTSDGPPDVRQQIAEAEAEGDREKAMRLKNAALFAGMQAKANSG